MSKTLLFGAIASVLTINAYADPVTITTQDYVDTAVGKKQDMIAGHQVGNWHPDSVITDTTSDGVVDKRLIVAIGNGIIGQANTWGGNLSSGQLVSKLAPRMESAGFTEDDVANSVISAEIIDYAFGKHHEQIIARQKNKVCVQYIENAEETSENCLLWNLPD